jgi:hypothetical protein
MVEPDEEDDRVFVFRALDVEHVSISGLRGMFTRNFNKLTSVFTSVEVASVSKDNWLPAGKAVSFMEVTDVDEIAARIKIGDLIEERGDKSDLDELERIFGRMYHVAVMSAEDANAREQIDGIWGEFHVWLNRMNENEGD